MAWRHKVPPRAVIVSALALALCVGVAGSAGSVLRVWLDALLTPPARDDDAGKAHSWPVGTLAANVLGSLVMGFATALALASGLPGDARTIVAVGFCGGLTTFSTFSVATFRLWESGRRGGAVGNILANVLLGVAAAGLGYWLGTLPPG
jgi:CrcB protein